MTKQGVVGGARKCGKALGTGPLATQAMKDEISQSEDVLVSSSQHYVFNMPHTIYSCVPCCLACECKRGWR